MPDEPWWLARLEAEGLLRREGERARTTKRWQAAMARAALRLYGTTDGDIRTPIALALLETMGEALDDERIAEAVGVFVSIELDELGIARPADGSSPSSARAPRDDESASG